MTEKGCLDATRHPRHEYVSLDTPLDGSRLHLVVVGLRTEFKDAEYILSKCSPRGRSARRSRPSFRLELAIVCHPAGRQCSYDEAAAQSGASPSPSLPQSCGKLNMKSNEAENSMKY